MVYHDHCGVAFRVAPADNSGFLLDYQNDVAVVLPAWSRHWR